MGSGYLVEWRSVTYSGADSTDAVPPLKMRRANMPNPRRNIQKMVGSTVIIPAASRWIGEPGSFASIGSSIESRDFGVMTARHPIRVGRSGPCRDGGSQGAERGREQDHDQDQRGPNKRGAAERD